MFLFHHRFYADGSPIFLRHRFVSTEYTAGCTTDPGSGIIKIQGHAFLLLQLVGIHRFRQVIRAVRINVEVKPFVHLELKADAFVRSQLQLAYICPQSVILWH